MRWKRLAPVIFFALLVVLTVVYILIFWLAPVGVDWTYRTGIILITLPIFVLGSIIFLWGMIEYYRERPVCPYCGTKNAIDALDCKRCGMKMPED